MLTDAERQGDALLTIERAAEVTGWSRAALYAAVLRYAYADREVVRRVARGEIEK